MQYKNSIEAIYFQLNEALQNVGEWGAESQLHAIDIDITLEKLRNVYDTMSSLKQELLITPNNTSSASSEKKDNTPTIVTKNEDIKPPITELEDKTIIVTASESADIATDQPGAEESIQFDVDEKEPNIEPEPEPSPKPTAPKPTTSSNSFEESSISGKYNKNRPTLHEELSTQVSSEDLANQLKNRPITNLSSAIGLNEKFEFIHNLFNGDKDKYEEAIEKLNTTTSFNEAYNYLSSTLNWDMSEALPQRVLELIRRKLIK